MVKMMSAEIESIEHELEQAIIALRKSRSYHASKTSYC